MDSSNQTPDPSEPHETDDDNALLDSSEALEEIPQNEDPDHPMDSDPDNDPDDDPTQVPDQEIHLQNDSLAHFDSHTSSIFAITQHPTTPSTIATGGGDDKTYIWSTSPALPSSTTPTTNPSTNPPTTTTTTTRPSLPPLATLSGHTDSITALTYTLPHGTYLLTGGLDGALRAHHTTPSYPLLATATEVPEINFLHPCPHPAHPNTIALGASDGSVWIYTVDGNDTAAPLTVVGVWYLHTGSCTAGAWTGDGNLLVTVGEEGAFYAWDVFGEIDAPGQAVVALTGEDQRFKVEGGLVSVAIAPGGAYAVAGGMGGEVLVVGLPRLGIGSGGATQGLKGGGAKNKPEKGGKKVAAGEGGGQAGQILARLQVQGDSVETLAFSDDGALLAAGSVDGSVVLFDTRHRFAVKRHIRDAHEGFAVVKVEFDESGVVSCGMDGVVRRWDIRGGTAAGGQGGQGGQGGLGGQGGQSLPAGPQGLLKEWRGHRGEGEGGGVLGFVLGGGRVVTAGDDGVALVFE